MDGRHRSGYSAQRNRMLPVGKLPVLRDYGEVRRSLQVVGGKDNGRQV